MARTSKALQQVATKPVINSESSARHSAQMLVKCRPPGRARNLDILNHILSGIARQRVPVNFGDLDGGADMPISPLSADISDRFSREGKEKMRSKNHGKWYGIINEAE